MLEKKDKKYLTTREPRRIPSGKCYLILRPQGSSSHETFKKKIKNVNMLSPIEAKKNNNTKINVLTDSAADHNLVWEWSFLTNKGVYC